jgi:Protein of unknown function (DUF3593)
MMTTFPRNASSLMGATAAFLTLLLASQQATAFLPTSPTRAILVQQATTSTTTLHMLDSASVIMDTVADNNLMGALASSSSSLLSFSDQGQNLAGIFFQASLLPYLLFLYFLSFKANRISPLGNFGFQFVLFFVASTIPSGIISKSVYAQSLANVDWLHGGAEALLTTANILIVSNVQHKTKFSYELLVFITHSRNLLYNTCRSLDSRKQ